MTERINVAALREACAAATPGPWQWFGNTKQREVYLATVDRGRVLVMDFVRWGMSGAQPRFQVSRPGVPDSGIMRSLGELGESESPLGPTFEVSYRRQFTGIGHPDAAFIAAARTALPAALDEIERLRGLVVEACDLAVSFYLHGPQPGEHARIGAIRAEVATATKSASASCDAEAFTKGPRRV